MVNNLTPEQQLLGQIYAWIDYRAEYLRAQQTKKEAETGRVSEAHPIPADSQALSPEPVDSITRPGDSQIDGRQDGTQRRHLI